METEEEVDILMSSDIYSATLSTKSITFTRAQTGWLFREDKTVSGEKIPQAALAETALTVQRLGRSEEYNVQDGGRMSPWALTVVRGLTTCVRK